MAILKTEKCKYMCENQRLVNNVPHKRSIKTVSKGKGFPLQARFGPEGGQSYSFTLP